jgi:hypothetical protein
LGVKRGLIRCKGDLLVDNLTLRGGPLNDTLSTKKSKIKCADDKLNLVYSNWSYGYWDISNSSEISFYKKDKTYINSLTTFKIKDENGHVKNYYTYQVDIIDWPPKDSN